MTGARKLKGNKASVRGVKSIVNTFPFNANEGSEHHDEHHKAHETQEHSQSLVDRIARQEGDAGAPDFGAVAAAGEKCIDKVVMM